MSSKSVAPSSPTWTYRTPDYALYEYLRRIANAVDALAPTGEPITAAHLGAGALTLVRYIQATRPGSRQVAVDIEPELMGFVTDRLPLPAGSDCQLVVGDARVSSWRTCPNCGACPASTRSFSTSSPAWMRPPTWQTATSTANSGL